MSLSKTILQASLAATAAVWLAGCYDSRLRREDASSADSGVDSRVEPGFDLGRDAAPRVDLGVDGDVSGCSFVGSWRRCGEACPLDCQGETTCLESLGLCVPIGRSADCSNDTAVDRLLFCTEGEPCVSSRSRLSEGACATFDVCAAISPDDPEFVCRWSDGSMAVDGSTELRVCPMVPLEGPSQEPFCGRECALLDGCTPGGTSCVGVSETRSLGVCAAGVRCFATGDRSAWDLCARFVGRECACVVTAPADASEGTFGALVTPEGCRAYRALYGADVVCRDRNWELLL